MSALKRFLSGVGLGVGLVLVGAGCSVNPATGKQQINFISEAQEVAMGREADVEIVASMGLYPDEELQAYVQRVGATLAKESERPHLPWTFRVLDDPLINAFALPGGYVYVTRGIMAHLDSEAELVGILGHEIGHITARHGVNRLSKQQLAGVGLVVGAVLSPEVARAGDLAQTGLGLLFLKYSREDERQSDELGLRYSLRSGYDPREIPEVFDLLERASQLDGRGATPNWLASHPDPGQRREWMRSQVSRLDVDLDGARVESQSYQSRLDGLVYGDDPRQGFFDDNRFLHPELAFSIDFPEGWRTQNSRQAVLGGSEGKDGLLRLTLASDPDPVAAARKFVGQTGVTGSEVRRVTVGGFGGASAMFRVEQEGGYDYVGRVTFLRDGDRVYQLLGYSYENRWTEYRPGIERAMNSFRRVTDRRVLDVGPRRLDLVDLERGLTLDEFERAYPSSVPLERIGLLNRLDGEGRLPADDFAKRVVGGPGG